MRGAEGFARFRTAAAVGAGGLACAALGAFAGGLGGHVTIAPAAAHSVATSSAPGHSLAASVNQGYRSSPVVGRSGAVAVASFATSGPLTQGGIAAFSALMPDPPPNRPVTASSVGSLGVPGAAGTAGGAGGTAGAPSDPPSPLEGLAPTMRRRLSDLTGALGVPGLTRAGARPPEDRRAGDGPADVGPGLVGPRVVRPLPPRGRPMGRARGAERRPRVPEPWPGAQWHGRSASAVRAAPARPPFLRSHCPRRAPRCRACPASRSRRRPVRCPRRPPSRHRSAASSAVVVPPSPCRCPRSRYRSAPPPSRGRGLGRHRLERLDLRPDA